MKTILGDDMYIFTRLNKVYDAMPATVSHSNKLFPRPPSPFDGPAMASTAPAITPPHVLQQGMFATASYANLRMRKEIELAEIIYYTVPKIPKAYSREYINDRLKKIGGMTPFNLWLVKELEAFFSLINTVKSSLQSIKHAIDVNSLGDTLNSEQLSVADDLYYQRIPELWRRSSGTAAPPPLQSLTTFINDITARATHFERILVLGREKNPAYWLGCFTNPQGLLTLLKQEYIKHSIANDRSGNLENFVYQTEITNRDKDHLRDPPAEGMFVHGIYIWGASWEKTTGELIDAPPRHGCTALPVIHVTCWPLSEKPSMQDPVKVNETYQCPVFPSRLTAREPIFEIDLRHDSIPATRWALRGLSATVRPF
ncbi:hypothetical protein EB796_003489 [Bugula neritina]|uniref:Dynein heavy chain C-terminal domain-containing protein n=1 Tax=Bugula neritina TaxID=10212 RepID=A0A7J7KKQ4_BUGNE|nr:hypothetical protein EB796_003489 [Bugula neritina]